VTRPLETPLAGTIEVQAAFRWVAGHRQVLEAGLI